MVRYLGMMNAPFQPYASPSRPAPARLTIDQYYAICESGALDEYNRTELLDGRIYQMNAQYTAHMRAKLALFRALDPLVRACGAELGMEATIEIGARNAPQPDLFVWTGKDVGKGAPDGTVLIAIEVADSSERHDLGKKRRIYARGGVREYWVAVLRTQTVERFAEPADGDYRRHDSFAFADAINSVTMPGIGIPAGTLGT
jgi:Uma2 family endonuclease